MQKHVGPVTGFEAGTGDILDAIIDDIQHGLVDVRGTRTAQVFEQLDPLLRQFVERIELCHGGYVVGQVPATNRLLVLRFAKRQRANQGPFLVVQNCVEEDCVISGCVSFVHLRVNRHRAVSLGGDARGTAKQRAAKRQQTAHQQPT